MSVGYLLVNATKRETINFSHLPVNTLSEIYSNPVTAIVVSWYMANNHGDEISFISDTDGEWPFTFCNGGLLPSFEDRTEFVLNILLNLGIIIDNGMLYQDEDEPETVFVRSLSVVLTDKT